MRLCITGGILLLILVVISHGSEHTETSKEFIMDIPEGFEFVDNEFIEPQAEKDGKKCVSMNENYQNNITSRISIMLSSALYNIIKYLHQYRYVPFL